MCEPISTTTAIALASAAASTGAGLYQTVRANSDAKRAAKARSDAALSELERQRGFRNEAQGVLTNALGGVDPKARSDRFNEAVQARTQTAASVAPAAALTPSIPNAPRIVQDNIAASATTAKNEADARTAALARVFAQGDVNQNTSIDFGRSGQKLSDIAGIAGVSNNLNSLEQNVAAQNAQKGPSIFADGIKGIGDLGLYLALSGQLGGKAPIKKSPGLTAPNNLALAGFGG